MSSICMSFQQWSPRFTVATILLFIKITQNWQHVSHNYEQSSNLISIDVVNGFTRFYEKKQMMKVNSISKVLLLTFYRSRNQFIWDWPKVGGWILRQQSNECKVFVHQKFLNKNANCCRITSALNVSERVHHIHADFTVFVCLTIYMPRQCIFDRKMITYCQIDSIVNAYQPEIDD